jgi:hypothetical protein
MKEDVKTADIRWEASRFVPGGGYSIIHFKLPLSSLLPYNNLKIKVDKSLILTISIGF